MFPPLGLLRPHSYKAPRVSSSSPPLSQQAQVAEVAAVSAHFAAPTGLAATGATIAGIKYMFVRGEENAEIYVKKVGGPPHACSCHPLVLVDLGLSLAQYP